MTVTAEPIAGEYGCTGRCGKSAEAYWRGCRHPEAVAAKEHKIAYRREYRRARAPERHHEKPEDKAARRARARGRLPRRPHNPWRDSRQRVDILTVEHLVAGYRVTHTVAEKRVACLRLLAMTDRLGNRYGYPEIATRLGVSRGIVEAIMNHSIPQMRRQRTARRLADSKRRAWAREVAAIKRRTHDASGHTPRAGRTGPRSVFHLADAAGRSLCTGRQLEAIDLACRVDPGRRCGAEACLSRYRAIDLGTVGDLPPLTHRPVPEFHPFSAKITEADAWQIRTTRATGRSLSDLARQYHLTESAVSLITRGLTWKHAGGPIETARRYDRRAA